MDMQFQVGQSVTFGLDVRQSVQFGFDVGGSTPAPAPAPGSSSVIFGNPIVTDSGYGHYLKPEPTPFFESI